MSRSEASVSPFILRSAAAVCSSASELTVALPTNNSPHPYPSLPLVEFLQLLLIALAKLVTDGLYKIGQLALVTARFGRKIVNLTPRTLNWGRDAEIQIRSDGCPVGEKASLSGLVGWFWRPFRVVFWMTTVTHRTLAARTLCPWPYRILLLYCSL